MLPKITAFPITTLGIARFCAIQVNANPMYTPYEQEQHRIDAGSFLKIVDRKKDLVIVSGFCVDPNKIEAVVSALARSLNAPAPACPTRKRARH